VVGENAPIDSGAGLQAPQTAAPGSEIRVTWTLEGSGDDHRVTIARADQADFTWIEAKSASDGPPVTFTAPDEAGTYEIRYLDLANQEVLGRVRVTVE
jgi:Ca-activated chloride channel family protein